MEATIVYWVMLGLYRVVIPAFATVSMVNSCSESATLQSK